LTVKFQEYIYDSRRRKALIGLFVTEENLSQHVWVEIAETADGWLGRLSRWNNVVPTAGVRWALDLVRREAARTVGRD
jgi:hypothetical protein